MKIPEPEALAIQGLIEQTPREAGRGRPGPHMGCSQLGHPWRQVAVAVVSAWAVQPQFLAASCACSAEARWEEATIVSEPGRAIGNGLCAPAGSRARVDFGAHVSGSIDAHHRVLACLQRPRSRHVAEFKTHSSKSFWPIWRRTGSKKSKPEHFVQMQLYMHGTEIDPAPCMWPSARRRPHLHRACALRQGGGRKVSCARRPQAGRWRSACRPPISTDPSVYQCKFCRCARVLPRDQDHQVRQLPHLVRTARPRRTAPGACETTRGRWHSGRSSSARPATAMSCTLTWCPGNARTGLGPMDGPSNVIEAANVANGEGERPRRYDQREDSGQTPRCAASGMSMWRRSCARPLTRGLWDEQRSSQKQGFPLVELLGRGSWQMFASR